MEPSLGIAGIATIDGSAVSNGQSVEITGKLKGEQLKLVKAGLPAKRTLEVDFAVNEDLKKQAGTVKRGDIHFGGAVASLTGTYNTAGEVAVVNLKLAGNKLDVTELGAFLPALDVVLPVGAAIEGGTAEVNFTAEGPADKLVSAGTVGLDSVKLANFDLATKMKVLNELAGIKAAPTTEIQTFHAIVKSAPEGTQVDELVLNVPSIGEITGAGTVSPAHALDFKMRAALRLRGGCHGGIGFQGRHPLHRLGNFGRSLVQAGHEGARYR